MLSAVLAKRKLLKLGVDRNGRHLNVSNIWQKHIMHSARGAEQKLSAAGIPRKARPGRIFIPLLSHRPDLLCDMLSGYSWNVAPFNSTSDVFVFSQNNSAAAAFTQRSRQRDSSCSNISYVSITLHFMHTREYWEVPPGTAAEERLWSVHHFKQEYRLMVSCDCAKLALIQMVKHTRSLAWCCLLVHVCIQQTPMHLYDCSKEVYIQ